MAVQHAKVSRVLKIQPGAAVLSGIGKFHVIKCIEELSGEGKPDPLGDFGGLGDGKIQVPAMLAIERSEIVGPAIEA